MSEFSWRDLFGSGLFKSDTAEIIRAMKEPVEAQWNIVTETLVPNPKVSIRADEGVPVPKYQTKGAAGFDLAIKDNIVVQPGEIVRATTGLRVKCPEGHFLWVTYRSSTPVRWGVQVLNGVLDEDYCGDDDLLGLQVWNFTDTVKRIPAGTRIGQGLFVPVTHAIFTQVDKMPDPSRGGYGSTGV